MKIFGRDDNVLCVALKVSVFVEKYFFQYILEHFFKNIALGIYINDVQCFEVILSPPPKIEHHVGRYL